MFLKKLWKSIPIIFPTKDTSLQIKWFLKTNYYIMKTIFENFKEPNKNYLYYQKIINKLPSGFKRDYAVGMTSHDYIFHLDVDTIYQPKAIERKLRFLRDNRLECVYCKSMLCYDIYGKQMYKTENKVDGYESTLFHTKEFWKKSGFKWEDIQSEAVSFYYR